MSRARGLAWRPLFGARRVGRCRRWRSALAPGRATAPRRPPTIAARRRARRVRRSWARCRRAPAAQRDRLAAAASPAARWAHARARSASAALRASAIRARRRALSAGSDWIWLPGARRWPPSCSRCCSRRPAAVAGAGGRPRLARAVLAARWCSGTAFGPGRLETSRGSTNPLGVDGARAAAAELLAAGLAARVASSLASAVAGRCASAARAASSASSSSGCGRRRAARRSRFVASAMRDQELARRASSWAVLLPRRCMALADPAATASRSCATGSTTSTS